MLKVSHLYKSYTSGKSVYPVLKDVSFEIDEGEIVAIMGQSGSGKTTLLNCISCFITFDEGEVLLGGHNIRTLNEQELSRVRNEKLGFVFQDFMLFDGLTVFENICVPQVIKGGQALQMENRARELCKIFGIEKIMKKYPAEISGGEKQRAAVARALMNHPAVILADEPTGNLDSKSRQAVIDSFQTAREQLQATIFMVTHDSYVASFCDRVIVLKDGCIFREVERNNQNQQKFMDTLLQIIREVGGRQHDS